ncbi:MAG: hypothetical protein HY902_01790, partial [Deltaproteobacteria bacterium]|nr:hypothetical protein [Deltaproteobacteria bacterium]
MRTVPAAKARAAMGLLLALLAACGGERQAATAPASTLPDSVTVAADADAGSADAEVGPTDSSRGLAPDATPAVDAEPQPDAVTDAMPNTPPDADSDAGLGPDPGPDPDPDPGPDATSDAGLPAADDVDAVLDDAAAAMPDAATAADTVADADPDGGAPPDAIPDTSPDTGPDAAVDAAEDTTADTAVADVPAPKWAGNPALMVLNLHQTWQHDPSTTVTVSWTTEAGDLGNYVPRLLLAPAGDVDANGANFLSKGKVFEGLGTGYSTPIGSSPGPKVAWHVEATGLQP